MKMGFRTRSLAPFGGSLFYCVYFLFLKASKMKYLCLFLLAFASFSVSAQGVPLLGATCPSGYHRDAAPGYCKPYQSNKNLYLLPKLTKTCPSGYHTDGTSGYCKPYGNAPPDKALIPLPGKSCPSGTHRDGTSGYCRAYK